MSVLINEKPVSYTHLDVYKRQGVMFALQMGAASGTLMLGALMDKLRPVTMSLLIYSGMLASLLALGTVSSFNGMLLAGFVAGLFATGGQSVLYTLAPLFYSSQIRATGVGTAVAVGRLGAMSGPLPVSYTHLDVYKRQTTAFSMT